MKAITTFAFGVVVVAISLAILLTGVQPPAVIGTEEAPKTSQNPHQTISSAHSSMW